jgi:flagellum-specific peptidoglycan hydrolase FlgJ
MPSILQTRQRLFPDDVVKAAQTAQKSTGCLASVSLAQWAQESGFGKYQLHANNPFGMKWYRGSKYGYVTVSTKEWIKGHYQTVEARFIAFPSLATAFMEHGKLLMNPKGPYKAALPYKSDWKHFILTIGSIYATDPNYSKSLVSLVTSYHLYDFDISSKPGYK